MPNYRNCHCFVPGCSSAYGNGKVSLFCPPKTPELLQQWKRLIPRADKELDEFCAVCELHFEEDFIIRDFVHVINGETVKIPRDKPKLKAEAIPTKFPNMPKHLSKTLPKKRKCREADNVANVSNGTVITPIIQPTLDNFRNIKLPSVYWGCQKPVGSPNSLIFHTVEMTMNVSKGINVKKLVILSEENSIFKCEVLLRGKQTESAVHINSPDELESFLKQVNEIDVCNGCGSCEELNVFSNNAEEWEILANRVYSINCYRMYSNSSTQSCLHCKYVRKHLLRKLNQEEKKKEKQRRNLEQEELINPILES